MYNPSLSLASRRTLDFGEAAHLCDQGEIESVSLVGEATDHLGVSAPVTNFVE